jgi:hypothetical protein
MQVARLKSSFASILAFGHMSGMSRSTHRKFIPAVAREIVPMPLTMTARDMGISFESDPVIFRAIHPVFDGRQAAALPEPRIEPVTEPSPAVAFTSISHSTPVPSWTWEVL